MNFGYLNFGTKDAVLVIAIFIILILTVLFRWSALEFVFSSWIDVNKVDTKREDT